MVLLVSRLFSSQDLDKVTLQLHWYHQFQFAGYYMANEKGFYEDAGIDVEIKEVDPSLNIVERVIQQESQYATGSSSLISDRSKGKKVVLSKLLILQPVSRLPFLFVFQIQDSRFKTISCYLVLFS